MKKVIALSLALISSSLLFYAKQESHVIPQNYNGKLIFADNLGYAEGIWKTGTDRSKPKLSDFIEGTIHYHNRFRAENYDGTFKNGKPYNGQFDIDHEYSLSGKKISFKGKVVDGKYYGHLKGNLGDSGLLSRSDIGILPSISFFDGELKGDVASGVFQMGDYGQTYSSSGYEITGTMEKGHFLGEMIVKYTLVDYFQHSFTVNWNADEYKGEGEALSQTIDGFKKTPFSIVYDEENRVFKYYSKTGEEFYSTSGSFLEERVLKSFFEEALKWTKNNQVQERKDLGEKLKKEIAANRASYKSKAVTFDTILRSWNNTARENPYYNKSFPVRFKIDKITSGGYIPSGNRYELRGKVGDSSFIIGTDDTTFTEFEYPITLYLYVKYYKIVLKEHYFRDAIFISK